MRALKVWTSSARIGCLGERAISKCSFYGGIEVNIHLHALPERRRVLVVPCINNAAADMFSCTNMSS
jgi:hypothetical protein